MADDDQTPPTPSEVPKGTQVTASTYDLMWEIYRDGSRSVNELVRRVGINKQTARRAIEQGWPKRNFAPLRQRAREHDQQKTEAERQAALDKHKEATDAWYRAGKQFNRVADNAVTFCILAMQQVSQLAVGRDAQGNPRLRPLTKWVRRRGVEVDEQGKRTVRYYDEEVPLTTSEAVKLETTVLKAAALAGAFKRLWPVTTDEQKAVTGPPQGISSLTLEEMDHVLNTGQLPPGKTSEDVFGYEVPGFPSKNKRQGPN